MEGLAEERRFRFSVAGGQPSGIYLLLWQGRVVYVGRSENVFARVSVHWNQLTRARLGLRVNHRLMAEEKLVEFDAVELIPVPQKHLGAEEQRLIQVYRPKYNKLLNREVRAPGFEKTPAFRELLKKKRLPSLKIRRMQVHV